jgi:hypothetical protein
MYLVYIIVQIHQLFNESKKYNFYYNCGRKEYLKGVNHLSLKPIPCKFYLIYMKNANGAYRRELEVVH